jgi:hypothetical protein
MKIYLIPLGGFDSAWLLDSPPTIYAAPEAIRARKELSQKVCVEERRGEEGRQEEGEKKKYKWGGRMRG